MSMVLLPTSFLITVTVGSPGQSMALILWTYFYSTWLVSPNSPSCNRKDLPLCSSFGTYVNTTSSSYRYQDSTFLIPYTSLQNTSGDYITETFKMGGIHQFDGVAERV